MLVSAIGAVICGAEGWEDIEAYGQAQAEWCPQFLDLPPGIPCHDTFRRVLARVNPDEFTQGCISWTEALRDVSQGEIVASDGKTLRQSLDHAASTAAIHLVRAWAKRHHLVLGQLHVEAKSNDITALPQLIKLLDLAGAIVTSAALGCQKDRAQAITAQDAADVLARKEHHHTLDDDVTRLFAEARATAFAGIAQERDETVEGDHGRIEPRT